MKNIEIDVKKLISVLLKNDATTYFSNGIKLSLEEDSLAEQDRLNIYYDGKTCTIGIEQFTLYNALYNSKTLNKIFEEKKYDMMSKEINIITTEDI